jgi:uncharacterized protein (DUF488 family)
MIYSIGYQGLTTERLVAALGSRGVEVLVDVRSKPFGRKPAFNRPNIARTLQAAGIGYEWKGDILGGFAAIAEESIQWLADYAAGQSVCIMCMEADPDRCHRKTEIARRLALIGVPVEHLTGADAPDPLFAR